DFTGEDGKPGSRYFINVAEIGVGAKVVDIANASSKVLGGKLTFMLASVRALVGWRDLPVRFSLDGGPFEETSVTTFAIANGRYTSSVSFVRCGKRLYSLGKGCSSPCCSPPTP